MMMMMFRTRTALPRITYCHQLSSRLFLRSFSSVVTDGEEDARVGFIGLGNMGLPMAMNLHNNNKKNVIVHDVNVEACNTAKAKGVPVAESLSHMVRVLSSSSSESSSQKSNTATATTIFTMLPSCEIVDSVMEELIQQIPPSGSSDNNNNLFVLVDCSTVNPTTSRKWNAEWTKHGHYFLDAPVSGGAAGAQAATLTFMVGGAKDNNNNTGLKWIRPYLECMGQRIIECGGPGAGSVAKLCNNLALAAQMIGIAEALTLGDALGVDPVILTNVMNVSTAKCWSSEVNNPHPIVAAIKGSPASKDYQGGFGAKLMLKDLGLALDAAKESNAHLPVTQLSKDLYDDVTKKGLGNKDFGVMFQYLKDSGEIKKS